MKYIAFLFLFSFFCAFQSAEAQNALGKLTVMIDSVPLRPASLQILGETVICPGSVTVLKVAGQYARYQWSTGHITPNVTVYKPGTYSVTVTTSGGCELTGTVVVRYPESPCL